MRLLVRTAVTAVAVVMAVAPAGCTGAKPEPRVATAARPTASAAPHADPSPSATKETDYDKALHFVRCMNALGETIPDPVEGTPIQMTSKKQGDWYVPSSNFPKCKQFLPATWPVKMDPKDLAKEKAFDDCLEKRGIDVPKPDANGMVHYPTDGGYYETPEYRAAEDACRYLYDDAANNQ
jgi:hypothetical protein